MHRHLDERREQKCSGTWQGIWKGIWKAKEFGLSSRFIELSGELNYITQEWVISKISNVLNNIQKSIANSKILIQAQMPGQGGEAGNVHMKAVYIKKLYGDYASYFVKNKVNL